jgi:hypothetical protein
MRFLTNPPRPLCNIHRAHHTLIAYLVGSELKALPSNWKFSTPLTWPAKICTAVNCHQVPARGSGAGRSGARWENISPDVLWGGATSHRYLQVYIYIPFYDKLGHSCFWPKHGVESIVTGKTNRFPYVAMVNTDLRIAIVGAGEFYFPTPLISPSSVIIIS